MQSQLMGCIWFTDILPDLEKILKNGDIGWFMSMYGKNHYNKKKSYMFVLWGGGIRLSVTFAPDSSWEMPAPFRQGRHAMIHRHPHLSLLSS